MHAASELLVVVVRLLHSLCQCAGDDSTGLGSSESSSSFEAVLSRHRHLSIQFKPPKAAAHDVKNVYAVWGLPVADPAAPRSLYVCGDADDYAPELEDILVNALVPLSHRKQPMILRALRLLYFLEDSPRFLKHFDRNFDGFNGIELPPILLRLKQRSAADAENFLAALSTNNSDTSSSGIGTNAGQLNQRGVSNLPAWMMQESGSSVTAQTDRADESLQSPPPSSRLKVPPPKRSEAEALNESPPPGQATAAPMAISDKCGDRVGERGISNLPAWMTQDAASAAGTSQAEGVAVASAAVCTPPPPPLSEIKIPVPKTAAEAAAAFPLLSLASSAGAKRDRADLVETAISGGSSKRKRESNASVMFQEVAMLLQDAELDASGEQVRLENLISNVVQSGDGLLSAISAVLQRAPSSQRAKYPTLTKLCSIT